MSNKITEATLEKEHLEGLTAEESPDEILRLDHKMLESSLLKVRTALRAGTTPDPGTEGLICRGG